MAICGKDGTINGSGANAINWTVRLKTRLVKRTTMSTDGYDEIIECIKSGGGSITTTTRFAGGATISLANDERTYAGAVKFGSESLEMDVNGIAIYTTDFTFSCGKDATINGVGRDATNWTVTLDTDLVDRTTMSSDGYKQQLACLKSGTGSITSTTRFSGGATIDLQNTQNTYAGTVDFGSESVSNDVDGIAEYTTDFTFNGSIVIA